MKTLIIALLSITIIGEVVAQQFNYSQMQNYNCTIYVINSVGGNYAPYTMDRLASLRADVHAAVANNDPFAAINFLNQIIQLDPLDISAFEFLGYSYTVVGNQASAAGVDIDIVARFEFVPSAGRFVMDAMNRLQAWDPYNWRNEVMRRRMQLGLAI
jgi:hypothetical protein